MDNYLAYVTAVAELNASFLTPNEMPLAAVFNAYAWGLIEEMKELDDACGRSAVLKEAGDVLAYVTLLLLCVSTIEDVAEVLTHGTSVNFTLLEFSSNLKRINREGAKFNWSLVVAAWVETLNFAREYYSFDFEEIAKANVQKLTKRAREGKLFVGSGSDR